MDQDTQSDPFFGAGDVVFYVLRQFYVVAIISIFISSLGNRPQGSRWIYILCMLLFAIIMVVILYLAGFTVYLVINNVTSQITSASGVVDALFSTPAFRDVVIATVSTYGMYLICSFAYLDPWHMLTCFLQYLLLVPSFINILNVYSCSF